MLTELGFGFGLGSGVFQRLEQKKKRSRKIETQRKEEGRKNKETYRGGRANGHDNLHDLGLTTERCPVVNSDG